MVDIVTPDLPIYRDRRLSDFAAPGSSVIGAQALEAFHDLPVAQTARNVTLDEAENGRRISRWGGRYEPDSPLLDRDSAAGRVKDAGLEGQLDIPETGIRERSLDLLIENKKEVNRRNAIIGRSPGGFALGTAGLATQLGVSLLDPTNIAMSFVPVVGEARYAAMLARAGSALGRTGVRAGVGAAEGMVGQALLEPLTYATDRRYQEEYGLNDALANIAFGGLFGAAVHNIAPAVRGAMRMGRGRDTTVTSAALSEAVAAHLEDRVPRVSEMLQAVQSVSARQASLQTGTSLTSPVGLGRVPEAALATPKVPMRLRAMDPQYATVPIADDQGRPIFYDTKSAADKARKVLKKKGIETRVDELRQGGFNLTEPANLQFIDAYPERFAAENAIKRMPKAERVDLRVVPIEATGRRQFAIIRGLTERQTAAAEKNAAYLNDVLEMAPETIDAGTSPQSIRPEHFSGNRAEPIAQSAFDQAFDDANPLETVLRQIRDDRTSIHPDESAALTQIEEMAKGFDTGNPVEAQLAEIESYATATEDLIALEREAGRITPEMDAALKDAAGAVSDADKRGNGFRQAALCVGRARA